jgi:morphogenesis family protein
MSGFDAIDREIRKLQELGSLDEEIAAEGAPELRRELEQQIARGQAPDGSPWQLTQDGEKPLKNAAASLSVRSMGPVILAKLEGPSARHHRGTARGRIRRQVLPSGKAPEALERALAKVTTAAYTKRMAGDG